MRTCDKHGLTKDMVYILKCYVLRLNFIYYFC